MAVERYVFVTRPWLNSQAKQRLKTAVNTLTDAGKKCILVETTGDWQRDTSTIKQAMNHATDVIAVGGDGTVNLVVNCLIGSQCRFGIIPAGTGNDYYRTAYGDQVNWLSHLCSTSTKAVDVGTSNGRYFINILGVGFDGHVVKQLDQSSNRTLGWLRYPLVVLKTLLMNPRTEIDIISDDYRYSGTVLTALIGKGQFFSRGVQILDGAQPTSGVLHCQWLPRIPLYKQVIQWVRLLKGRKVPEHLKHGWQCEHCQIITEGLPVQGDGEYFGLTPISVRLHKGAIQLKYQA